MTLITIWSPQKTVVCESSCADESAEREVLKADVPAVNVTDVSVTFVVQAVGPSAGGSAKGTNKSLVSRDFHDKDPKPGDPSLLHV